MKRRVLWLAVCLILLVSMLVAPVSAYASSKAKFMQTTERVNLRDPNDYTKVIGSLKKGTKVLYTGKAQKAFYLVQTSSGKLGYVFKMYLNNLGSINTSSVYRISSETKLYKKPSTSSHRVTTLGSGRYVQVTEYHNGWAYVKTTNGKKGYVQTSYLTK